MKVYQGHSASPGLVMGQVSRLERWHENFATGPFNAEREQRLLENAVRTAQRELDGMADRSGPTEQAIFLFQSMMLEDEGFMNEVKFQIKAGISAAEAMYRVGNRYAEQLAAMEDNAYMQLRSADILDAARRVVNVLTNRPRVWLALDHPVILAAEMLMPSDLFSVPAGMILGIITSEGNKQSHAAIIARAMHIPCVVQVGQAFLNDCDGRTVVLDANNGECILDPDANTRQQAVSRICELQWESEEAARISALPNRTKDDMPFELLANCYGQEDIESALQAGASGVGLLRSGYMMLPGRPVDEQEQFVFYQSCLAAAKGGVVTVRTFDFGVDRAMADIHRGLESSKLGLRGIRSSLRQTHQFETQICALLRAAAHGPLRVMFPMVTNLEDWDEAMRLVAHCRQLLRERGEEFDPDTPFGVMFGVPSACLTAEEFVEHGCNFFVIETNDLTQYLLAVDRNNTRVASMYDSLHPAVLRALAMIAHDAERFGIDLRLCGEMAGDPMCVTILIGLGYRHLSMNGRSVARVKYLLRRIDIEEAQELSRRSLDAQMTAEVRHQVAAFMERRGLGGLIRGGR